MSRSTSVQIRCANCGREIEVCEGCQEPGCGSPTCYECMIKRLGRPLLHPYAHGR